jgi:pimeloyl-ACP methyl ester carboxylesterase
MLHYEVSGSGPPVVLLHEGIVDSRSWGKVVPLLAPHHTVVTYDQRGYGRSPRPTGPYSLTDDLAWVLDAADLERAALAGTSRGGRIAIDFALTHPERVTALVPIAAAVSGHRLEIDVTEELERRWEEAEASGDLGAMAALDLEVWAPLGADAELRAMAVENVEWSNAEDPGLWADPPAVGRLGEITAPTLVITGRRDVTAMTEIGDLLAREIPGARRVVIDESDHVVEWRAPEEVARLLLDFLRD